MHSLVAVVVAIGDTIGAVSMAVLFGSRAHDVLPNVVVVVVVNEEEGVGGGSRIR